MEYNCYGQPIGPSLKESCFRELNATIIEGNTCDLIHASEDHAHLFYTDIFKKGLTAPDWTSHPFNQKERFLIFSTRLFCPTTLTFLEFGIKIIQKCWAHLR